MFQARDYKDIMHTNQERHKAEGQKNCDQGKANISRNVVCVDDEKDGGDAEERHQPGNVQVSTSSVERLFCRGHLVKIVDVLLLLLSLSRSVRHELGGGCGFVVL